MIATDAFSLAVELGVMLDTANFSYAIGGALALGVHGVSRSTQDVDLNVFIKLEDLDRLFSLFQANGIAVNEAKARQECTDDGVFFCWANGTRIDVFLPSIDLSWEAERTRKQINVEGRGIWFLSPEMLACFKLLFYRPKDILDLERLVAISKTIDLAEVRKRISQAMGEDDERVKTWDKIVADAKVVT